MKIIDAIKEKPSLQDIIGKTDGTPKEILRALKGEFKSIIDNRRGNPTAVIS